MQSDGQTPRKTSHTTWVVLILVIVVFQQIFMPFNPHYYNRRQAMNIKAKMEMADLATATEAYHQTYGHLPLADTASASDITSGITPADINGFQPIPGTRLVASNSDLLIVLMDFDQGINAGHKMNPQRIKFVNARMTDDTNSGGVSVSDFQYRDPWGHPYVISLDANEDRWVRDAFYADTNLYRSGLTTGLRNRDGFFEVRGRVAVWSRGRDGQVSRLQPTDLGVNKDNIVSWQ